MYSTILTPSNTYVLTKRESIPACSLWVSLWQCPFWYHSHCPRLLCSISWKVLGYPPYSLDLSPCDFHVSRPFQSMIGSDEIKAMVVEWFHYLSREFFVEVIDQLASIQCLCQPLWEPFICTHFFTLKNPEMGFIWTSHIWSISN